MKERRDRQEGPTTTTNRYYDGPLYYEHNTTWPLASLTFQILLGFAHMHGE